jgi:hypothetical protein
LFLFCKKDEDSYKEQELELSYFSINDNEVFIDKKLNIIITNLNISNETNLIIKFNTTKEAIISLNNKNCYGPHLS